MATNKLLAETNVMVTKREGGVKELRSVVQAWLATNPESLDRMPMKAFMAASGWKYSRTWQVARRWVLEAKAPSLIVDCSALVKGKDVGDHDRILAAKVIELRAQLQAQGQNSWGEVNVRMGLSEGRVRTLFTKYSGLKDRGLRIGKGGAFVTANPTLYLNNMKGEGAQIDEGFKGIPTKPEQCKNFKKPVVKRAVRAKKASAA